MSTTTVTRTTTHLVLLPGSGGRTTAESTSGDEGTTTTATVTPLHVPHRRATRAAIRRVSRPAARPVSLLATVSDLNLVVASARAGGLTPSASRSGSAPESDPGEDTVPCPARPRQVIDFAARRIGAVIESARRSAFDDPGPLHA